MENLRIKKTVLIIGGDGMMGWTASKYFKKRGSSVISLKRRDFDIVKNNVEDLIPYITKSDFLINCAGIIKSRIAVTSIEETIKLNSIFPRNLADLAEKYKTMCFHITTDCVFSGKKGSYSENDYIDADDLYGLTKACGETKNCMNLRTSIIGEEKRNFYSLLEWVKNSKKLILDGYVNHKWNGLTTLCLSETIEQIVVKNLYQKGIFHIFSPKPVSKYQLICMINRIYKLNKKVRKVKTRIACDRTLVSLFNLSSMTVKKSIFRQIKELYDFCKNANS